MILLISFLLSTARAADFHISCNSSVNSVQVYTQEDRVYFRFYDSLGFKDFPVFNGMVTPVSVPFITRGVRELAVFDGSMRLSWERKLCRYDESKPLLVMCEGSGRVEEPAGAAFTPTGMNTAVETQERLDLSFARLNFNVGLNTPSADFMHYFLQFPFNKVNCTAH
jgi:hypothetical protein